jgi:uncharacterized membrane protein
MNSKAIGAALICILILDFIYLSLTKKFYNNLVRSIQGENIVINNLGLLLAYFFIIFGYYYFIIRKNASVLDAFLLGLTTYGIYEGTNYAIFKKWTLQAVLLDTLWGGVLFGATRYLTQKLNL